MCYLNIISCCQGSCLLYRFYYNFFNLLHPSNSAFSLFWKNTWSHIFILQPVNGIERRHEPRGKTNVIHFWRVGIEKIQVGESGIAFKTLNARLFTCNKKNEQKNEQKKEKKLNSVEKSRWLFLWINCEHKKRIILKGR